MLKYFRGAPLKIYLYEYLTHEYFHTRKFPDVWYSTLMFQLIATVMHYPCIEPLPTTANWSAFLEQNFIDPVKAQLRQ